MGAAVLPEGLEIYPAQKRLVLLGDDLIVHNAMCFYDGQTCFTILCGENGWWADLMVWVNPTYRIDFWCMPADWVYGENEVETPIEAAELIAELSCRTRPVPKRFQEDRSDWKSLGGLWVGFDYYDWS